MQLVPDGPRACAKESGKPRPPFDPTTIVLHWTTVVLVLLLIGGGLLRNANGLHAATSLWIHRSLGVTVWIVTVLRLGWRLTGAYLPEFPPTMTPLHTMAGRLSEYALYALLLLQPATGLAQSLWRGRPFDLFAGRIAPLLAKHLDRTLVFHRIHEVGAWCLIGLVGVHAAAALYHHFVRGDEILTAMVPALRRRALHAVSD